MLLIRILVLFIIVTSIFCDNCAPCKCVKSSYGLQANCRKSEVNLTNVPEITYNKVNDLSLNSQILKILPDNVFVHYYNLSKIELYFCEIETIEEDAFKNQTTLKYLEMGRNKLKDVPIDTFQHTLQLEELVLNENNLQYLKKGLLSNLIHLKYVTFHKNNIKYIDDNFFEDNVNIKTIILSNNELQYMMLNNLHLTQLDLSENRWKCNCKLFDLYKIYSSIQNNDRLTEPKCLEPSNLYNEPWTKLTKYNFTCKPEVKLSPENNILLEDQQNVTIKCSIYGNPINEIKILKNGKSIFKPNLASENFSVMFNFTALVQETTTYSCFANGLGFETKSVTFSIRQKVKQSNNILMIALSTVGVLIILGTAIAVFYFVCRKKSNSRRNSRGSISLRFLANNPENLEMIEYEDSSCYLTT